MAVAPARKARAPRPLKTDERQDLRSSELQSWQTNYLANMQAAKEHKAASRTAPSAKKFAAACVFGNGLAGLGLEGPMMQEKGPLAMFTGQNLREMVFGKIETSESRGKKRRSTDAEQSDDEQRKSRRTSNEIEVGRAQDEDGGPIFEDVGLSPHTLSTSY